MRALDRLITVTLLCASAGLVVGFVLAWAWQ